MCLDHMEMISREYGKITCTPIISNPSAADISYDGDKQSGKVELHRASGPYGSIVHREVQNENYSIWHSHYTIRRKMTLTISSNEPALSLNFVLKSDINFRLDGFLNDTMLQQQYNMVYLPRLECEYTFLKSGEYELFGIYYTHGYLEQWTYLFPHLKNFLNKANNHIPSMISYVHPTVTLAMKPIIDDILQCIHQNSLRKMWLEAKCLELLDASLEQFKAHNSRFKRLSLSEVDLNRIKQVRAYLLQQLDQQVTLKGLAHEVGTNIFKLKKGFKLIFGVTVFEFLREERMQKARRLLLETHMPIYKIASTVGYNNPANFTTAFKKRFGQPPGSFRG